MQNIRNRLKINPILVGLIFLFMQAALLNGCAPRPKQITIWHWMEDREDVFDNLSKRYLKETGIGVKFIFCGAPERYAKRIGFAAKIGRLPDIYGMLSGIWDFSRFIKFGYAIDLSDDLNANEGEWRNKFFEEALSENEFLPNNDQKVNPGIYGISIDMNNIQIVYNKDLFKVAGLDPEKPPKTWEEFIICGKRLKEAGIPAFVSGWGELWMIDCFASNYAFNLMGEEKIIQTIKGQVSYISSDWVRVLQLFEEMRDAGILVDDITVIDNKMAEEIFATSQAAMAFNGSWCVNVYRKMNPALNYGVMMPPKLSNKYPMKIWGGAGAPFVVNAKSKNKKEAIDFLKWLTAEKQQIFLANATYNLPVNKWVVYNISSRLREFADDIDSLVHPKLMSISENSRVTIALDGGIQAIIRGQKSPTEVATSVNKMKRVLDRYRTLEYFLTEQ